MTPAELIALADAATPGPWRARGDRIMAMGPPDDDEAGAYIFGSLAIYDATGEGERNARLIALAPDLARLCAEMGEALERVYDHVEANFPASVGISPMFASARAALAKLSELKP